MSSPLTIRFATDIEPARKGIASLRADTVSNLNAMNAAFSQGGQAAGAYGKSFGLLGDAVGAFVLGAAALEGVGEIARRLSHELDDAAGRVNRLLQISATSDATGVGTSFIQSLLSQTKDLGIEASGVIKILENAKKAGAVTLGDGSAGSVSALNASPFQRRLTEQQGANNLTAADRAPFDTATAAKDAEGQLKAVLDLLDKLDARGKSLTADDLSKKFFDENFDRNTKAGIAFLDALRRASTGTSGSTGRVATPDEVARATELKRELQDIERIYNGTLAQATKDIAYYQDLASQQALSWKHSVADVVSHFRDIYTDVRNIVLEAVKFGQTLGLIGDNFGKFQTDAQKRRQATATVDSGFTGGGDPIGRLATALGASGASQADLDRQTDAAQMAAARERLRRNMTASDIEQAKDQTDRMDFRNGPLKVTVPALKKDNPIIDKPKGDSSLDPDAVEQYIRQLNKLRDVQQAELAAVGKTVAEREMLVALAKQEANARDDFEKGRRSTATLDADEIARTLAAAKATGDLKAKVMDLEQAQGQAADTARYFGQQITDGLADAIVEGRSLEDVFSNLAKTIAKAALQAELLGTGPLAALLGTSPAASSGPNAIGGLLGQLVGGTGAASAANAPAAGAQGPTLQSPGFFAQIASMLGFAEGGYTGNGSRDEPAGIVHRGEYVIPKVAVARIGVPMLNALARGMPGYATGGMVGAAALGTLPASGAEPRFNFIDQRPAGSADITPAAKRNSDGGWDVVIRGVESRLGQRATNGQGPFRQAAGGPAFNRG